MSRVRKWIKRILWTSAVIGTLLVALGVASFFFFSRQLLPKLLLQPARYTDRLQYVWNPFDRVDFRAQTADGLSLACFYGKSKASPARGSCLILHGHSYGKDGMAGLAKRLTEQGYDVIAFDARAHGESQGDITTVGNLEGVDAIAVAKQAEQKFPVPHPRIVIGTSLGAATAIRMITLPGHTMDAAVIISPYARLRDVVTRETKKYLWFANTAQVMQDAEKQAGRDLWSFSPIDLASEISIPVLELHGTADERFPIEEAREVFHAIGTAASHPAKKQMVEAWGAGHNDVMAGGLPWSEEISGAFDSFLKARSKSN
jgi:alpha-beta hydrolase superfamily lysophospholipase